MHNPMECYMKDGGNLFNYKKLDRRRMLNIFFNS